MYFAIRVVLLTARILPFSYGFYIERLVRASHQLSRQKHADTRAGEVDCRTLFVACVEYVCFIVCATQRPPSPSGTRVALCLAVQRDPGWGCLREGHLGEQSFTKPLSAAGLSRLALNPGTRNEVRRHAAASVSPLCPPPRFSTGTVPPKLPRGARKTRGYGRPGGSPVPGALIETICSAPERRKRAARCLLPSFLPGKRLRAETSPPLLILSFFLLLFCFK